MQSKIHIGGIDIVAPRKIVYDILKYTSAGTALDLGAGFGRHSLFLAFNGFMVTAVEKEQERLVRLVQQAKNLPSKIHTTHEDIVDFETTETFDVVVAAMVLHYLQEDEVDGVIKKMKRWTNEGGINVISSYTDKNPTGLRAYQLKTNELKECYADWEILQYEESLADPLDAPTDGGPQRRWSAQIIARKPNFG